MKKLETFIVREIAGEYVMMPVGATAQKYNGIVMVNIVSAFIWNHLEEVDTVEELTAQICEEFEVTYEKALQDTAKFVAEMRQNGLVE